MNFLAAIVSSLFLGIAVWHVRMALGPMTGGSHAVPSVDGKPLFVPSRQSTLLVAAVLLLFAALVAATGGLFSQPLPAVVLAWLSYALAVGLVARAVGDFKYVGLFKRVRGSAFARLDSLVYSPLCLLLAAGVARVAWQPGA